MSLRTLVVAAVSRPVARPSLRTSLLAMLALIALLLGMLAMHSAASTHVMGIPLPVASSVTAHANTAPMEHAASAHGVHQMTHVVVMAAAAISAGQQGGMLDCALMVMACAMLLVLAAIVLLSRRPALDQRLRDIGSAARTRLFAVTAPIHRPSITVLCISRT